MAELGNLKRVLERVAIAIPYICPVLGGLLGVAYVNSNPMKFLNPVVWIGGGALLGWIIAWIALKLLSRVN